MAQCMGPWLDGWVRVASCVQRSAGSQPQHDSMIMRSLSGMHALALSSLMRCVWALDATLGHIRAC